MIFGSRVRGCFKSDSDIDIVVKLSEPISLLNIVEMEEFLENCLGLRVDLVLFREIKPLIKERILKEAIVI